MAFTHPSTMPRLRSIEEALDQEFTCYYMADVLPQWDSAFLTEGLADMAKDSAKRLRHSVGDDQAPILAARLREAADAQGHALVAMICDVTWIEWTEEENWPVLQRLLRLIADQI